jgi:hypothetical protein
MQDRTINQAARGSKRFQKSARLHPGYSCFIPPMTRSPHGLEVDQPSMKEILVYPHKPSAMQKGLPHGEALKNAALVVSSANEMT